MTELQQFRSQIEDYCADEFCENEARIQLGEVEPDDWRYFSAELIYQSGKVQVELIFCEEENNSCTFGYPVSTSERELADMVILKLSNTYLDAPNPCSKVKKIRKMMIKNLL